MTSSRSSAPSRIAPTDRRPRATICRLASVNGKLARNSPGETSERMWAMRRLWVDRSGPRRCSFRKPLDPQGDRLASFGQSKRQRPQAPALEAGQDAVLSAWLHSEPHPGPARQTTDSDARSRRYQTGSGGRTRTFMSSDQAALRHLYCSPRVDPEIMPEGTDRDFRCRRGARGRERSRSRRMPRRMPGSCFERSSTAGFSHDKMPKCCNLCAVSMTDHKARSEPQVIAAVTLHLKEHVADTWCPCSECGADRACCRAVTGG